MTDLEATVELLGRLQLPHTRQLNYRQYNRGLLDGVEASGTVVMVQGEIVFDFDCDGKFVRLRAWDT